MAKILYGVCGVGAGHYTRSKILIDHLAKNNKLFIVGTLVAYDYLKKNFKNVHLVEGLEFAFKDNRVLSLTTIFKNIKKISRKNYDLLKRVKAKIDKFDPEIVISDFEIFSIYYGKNKLKIISFDNEHFLVEGDYETPVKYKVSQFKAKFVVNLHKTDISVIPVLPGQKLNKNSNAKAILPLIRDSLNKIGKNRNYILVYTSIINYQEISKILCKLNEKFLIFGARENKVEKNLIFRKFSDREFDKALLNCKAVITGGGINLISEALYLKKPLLVIPFKNQFEQTLNALYVKNNNYGEMYEELNEENLQKFLNNLDEYKKCNFKPGNRDLFRTMNRIIKGEKK